MPGRLLREEPQPRTMKVTMPTIAYNTLGCKVNQYETEKIREELERAGFTTVPFSSRADSYVINTCSVTGVADSKSRAAIRRAVRQNPEAYVVATGCYIDLEPGLAESIEDIDLLVPTDQKSTIAERLIARFGQSQTTNRESQIIRPRLRTRAVVKVQDGCDQFCSYCVIPYARSRKWSRPVDEVIREVQALAAYGYKEIVLTGIRLGSYAYPKSELADLVLAVAEVDGVERVRLSSIEQWEITDALLDAMRHTKICRHLHIPLQSGDDDVLRRMNRPYTSTAYLDLVERVRELMPGIGITTDVIVGFPGETDEAFANTCRVVDEAGFSRLHVFRYSPRKRTPAAAMPDQVDEHTKKLRADILAEMGRSAVGRFAESQVGKILDVLVESRNRSETTGKHLLGFADNYVEVRLPGDNSLVGSIVRVEITGVDQDGRAIGRLKGG